MPCKDTLLLTNLKLEGLNYKDKFDNKDDWMHDTSVKADCTSHDIVANRGFMLWFVQLALASGRDSNRLIPKKMLLYKAL